MTKLMNELYYMVEDWVGQHDLQDEKTKNLETRLDALQNQIILRLGEDGQELMEALTGLALELEVIHDQALFRAAMRLGAQIAQPRRSMWTPSRASSNPRAAAGRRGPRVERRARRKGHA